MQTRKRNASVAIMANTDTMEMRNAEAADGSPKVSYAAVVASPRRSTRSRAAPHAASPVGGGNKAVADDTLGAKQAKPPSPPAPATDAAPAEDGPPPPATKEQLAARDAEIHDLQDQLANHPASQLKAKQAKPPSPPAPATNAAPAEDGPPPPATKEQLAARDAEIHDLQDQLANHPASQLKAYVDGQKWSTDLLI